eukprot:GHVP01001480.1.p1 GENE.GHVP01001480.1~~GHVP01001480.1.p1  ORF type:complete len:697 (+),score=121.88 GHVP01001480.1:544-2634(+)
MASNYTSDISKFTCSISPVKCVKNEIHNVLTVFRLTTDLYMEAKEDGICTSLIRQLKNLFDRLNYVNEFHIDKSHMLPFLNVITHRETNGPVTAVALAAVNKFVNYGLIRPDATDAADTINSIAEGVVGCLFQGSATDSDEVVLQKILMVLVDILRCSSCTLIEENNVWNMVKLAYQISRQPKASFLLRSSAEQTISQMTLQIFSAPSSFPDLLFGDGVTTRIILFLAYLTSYGKSPSKGAIKNKKRIKSRKSLNPEAEEKSENDDFWDIEKEIAMPHVNPLKEDWEFYQEMRSLGLSLLNCAVETAGHRLEKIPGVVECVQDQICKALLQNSQTGSLFLLSSTLRCVFNLFLYMKQHIKVQLEVFFTSIHVRLADFQSTTDIVSLEQKELALESLLEFCREPDLIVDLYRNYDCDVHSSNLFESLLKLLLNNATSSAKEAFLSQKQDAKKLQAKLTLIENSQLLSISGINSIIHVVQSRSIRHSISEEASVSGNIQEIKERKTQLETAAQVFNADANKCIEALQNLGILERPTSAEKMARFIKDTPGLDTIVKGRYLSNFNVWNASVREEYVKLFDMKGKSLYESIRAFLLTFSLPGEAQEIDRVVESFSNEYFRQQLKVPGASPSEIESKNDPSAGLSEEMRTPRYVASESFARDSESSVSLEEHVKDLTVESGHLDGVAVIMENSDTAFIFLF